MPRVAGKQPHCWLVPESSPVAAQLLEQRRTQHHIPVLAPLASSDMNHHPLAVDVAYLQASYFSPACSRGIQRHDQDALKGRFRGIDQTCDLLLAQDLRKVQDLLRIRSLGCTPASLQDLDVKEAQSGQTLGCSARSQLPVPKHRCLVLPDVLRTEPVGWTVKMPGEVLDRANVGVNGARSVVAHDLT
jgi:hypothetical protein